MGLIFYFTQTWERKKLRLRNKVDNILIFIGFTSLYLNCLNTCIPSYYWNGCKCFPFITENNYSWVIIYVMVNAEETNSGFDTYPGICYAGTTWILSPRKRLIRWTTNTSSCASSRRRGTASSGTYRVLPVTSSSSPSRYATSCIRSLL